MVKPLRVIVVVPRETLDRLATAVNGGPRGIKVHLVDMDAQRARGHSLRFAAGYSKRGALPICDARAMPTSLWSRFHRGEITDCLFDRIRYLRMRSDKQTTAFVPTSEQEHLASTRHIQANAVRVRLSDTAQEGSLG